MRPIWSGTISFGLVSVPVRMFPAPERVEEQEAEVVDLMEALRESVERTQKKHKTASKRKAS